MTPNRDRMKIGLAIALAAAGTGLVEHGFSQRAYAQSAPADTTAAAVAPTNDAPNPYKTVSGWAKLPEGRQWGSTSAVDIDRDGKSVWVAERCGGNGCFDRTKNEIQPVDTILKFDETGKLVKSFGAGMVVFPHGIYVDKQDNIWITDGQDNGPVAGRGGAAAAGGARGAAGRGAAAKGGDPAAKGAARAAAPAPTGPIGPPAGATKGNQVFKFSKDGKLLLTLGTPGGAAAPGYFYQPNDVIVAKNGDIFVSEGHGRGNNRVMKFTKDGKFIKEWGKLGTGPGEFDQPHALAFDSKGRLFVGDRNNNRIQIFDQEGKFLGEMRQFSRPSGIFIDKHDMLYVADSESESVSRNHDGWKRGIRIGSIKTGKIVAFIPDPVDKAPSTSAAEGVAVDAAGNIYGAEVGPKALKRYEPIAKK
jgi:NHL repeat